MTTPHDEDALSSPIRVLVIEDDPDQRRLIAFSLEEAGCDVTLAATGADALRSLDHTDVLVVDQGLPDMAGIDVMTVARELSDPPAMVMVTVSNSPRLAADASRLGAVDFLPKSPGFATNLPPIVERAYWRRDLARRTDLLRRLVLDVNDSTDPDEAMRTLVDGTLGLLRASAAVVAKPTTTGRWTVVAAAGPDGDLRAAVQHHSGGVKDPWTVPSHQLVVLLSGSTDEHDGVLLVERSPSRPFGVDEHSLAATFAGLVGAALGRARRAKVETGLIEELQRTLRVRHDLVASVSHELRTPLTAIGGYTDVLLRHDDLAPDRRRDYLTRIRANADRLERLVDEMILVADLERGRRLHPDIVPLDLAGELDAAVAALPDVVVRHDLDVDIDAGVVVAADRKLLRRVVGHLVTNAAKYSPSGTSIVVRARTEGGRVVVSVSDEGPGVAEHDAKRIFDPFWRGEVAVAQAIPGTGLGLTLVREYVGAMDGTLALADDGGPGATFEFTLPLSQDPPAASQDVVS